MTPRPSYLIASPHADLVRGTGPVEHMIALGTAMARARGALVSLVFRRTGGADLPAEARAAGVSAVSIEAGAPTADGVALRLDAPLGLARYVLALRAFGRAARGRHDALLEKGSRLSGVMGGAFAGRAAPYVALETHRPTPPPPRGGPVQRLGRRLLADVAERMARRGIRRAARVVVERPELAAWLAREGYSRAERLRVVPAGVDRERFRPADQAAARAALGLDPAATIAIYVGSLDLFHDLGPLVHGLARAARPGLALHVIGDGAERAALEEAARASGAAVRLHGRVPPDEVPRWIAAADLGVAPYASAPFAGGRPTFSTLKVREMLACGRPVATTPDGGAADLVRPGETGFHVAAPAAAEAWAALFASLPDRAALERMRDAAARTGAALPGWDEVAARLLSLVDEARASGKDRC